MKLIDISTKKFANLFTQVDDSDFDWLNQWKWHCTGGKNPYAKRRERRTWIVMHRLIIKTPPGMVTDHIDGDGLNNQRANLRICNQSQNIANSLSRKKTNYKGVKNVEGRYRAGIQYNGRHIHIGYFENAKDAAIAYDKKSLELFGSFSRGNFTHNNGG